LALLNDGVLAPEVVESSSSLPISQLYEILEKILRDNQILKTDEEEHKEKTRTIFEALVKLQKNFIGQSNKNK
jgi:hypothetical protein